VSNGSERRKDPRYSAHFDVRFARASDAAKALNANSMNFSAGGLCVRTQNAYSLGEPLTMSLSIEGETFELEAAVSWIRGDAVGVRFVNLEESIRLRLESVARLLGTRGPPLT